GAGDEPLVPLNFRTVHTADFLATLSRQEQKFIDASERLGHLVARLPKQTNLVVRQHALTCTRRLCLWHAFYRITLYAPILHQPGEQARQCATQVDSAQFT